MAYVREDLDSPRKIAELENSGGGTDELGELLGDPEDIRQMLEMMNAESIIDLIGKMVTALNSLSQGGGSEGNPS